MPTIIPNKSQNRHLWRSDQDSYGLLSLSNSTKSPIAATTMTRAFSGKMHLRRKALAKSPPEFINTQGESCRGPASIMDSSRKSLIKQ